ncbi:MAG: hypothetical protein K0Q95_1238 [Bacteroidota bacterium]|jgi:hypothetical protein|nr:hypothetical protein [Bacteroidota bacterium]
MKKVIFIAIVAVASLASCKKDRVCTCTSGGTAYTKTFTKAKKADARAACLSTTSASTTGGTSYVTTCELK